MSAGLQSSWDCGKCVCSEPLPSSKEILYRALMGGLQRSPLAPEAAVVWALRRS